MRPRQIVLVNIIVIVIVAALAATAYWYFYNRNNYIKDDDAQVTVGSFDALALSTGKLTAWNVATGDHVTQGEVIGTELLPTGQSLHITAPATGQVLQTQAVSGQVVSCGTLLAVVADLNSEYILANIKETEIRHVKRGQTVDVYLDAYPGTTFSGTVTRIDVGSGARWPRRSLPASLQATLPRKCSAFRSRFRSPGRTGNTLFRP